MIRPQLWARTSRVLLLCVLAVCEIRGQQLDYSRTAFIHGFGSSSSIWTTPRAELGGRTTTQYVGDRVDLGTLWLPSWGDPATVFATEWQQVRDSLNASAGRIVFAGHSLGGMVARYAYLQSGPTARSRTAAILTVATPHQGTLLADSAQQLGQFASELKHRVDDAAPWAEVSSTVLVAFIHLLTDPGELFRHFFINIPAFPNTAGLTQVATLPALATNGGVVGQLTDGFDATVPRANIVARMSPADHMPVRLGAALTGESEQAKIDDFRKLRSAFSGCKWFYGLTGVAISVSNKCSDAERMLGQFDATWQRYLNGSSTQQICGTVWYLDGPYYKCWNQVQPILNVPSDGVVTNSRSVYPGHTTGEFWESPVVVGANHNTVYRVAIGVDRMVDGMLVGLRMRTPPPPPPPPFSVNISGQTYLDPDVTYTWYSSVSNGASPYTYDWAIDGAPAGTGSGVSRSFAASTQHEIQLIAWDSQGQSASAILTVDVGTGQCPPEGCSRPAQAKTFNSVKQRRITTTTTGPVLKAGTAAKPGQKRKGQ